MTKLDLKKKQSNILINSHIPSFLIHQNGRKRYSNILICFCFWPFIVSFYPLVLVLFLESYNFTQQSYISIPTYLQVRATARSGKIDPTSQCNLNSPENFEF